MSETKPHQFRPPLYNRDVPEIGSEPESSGSTHERGREQKGWDAYRKWLSTVSSQGRSARTPVDHSIYSWKGYHNWADRIKQTWEPEDN